MQRTPPNWHPCPKEEGLDTRLAKHALIAVIAFCVCQALAQGPPAGRGPFGKSYYLTADEHFGDEVVNACVRGYHFASFWEIRETSHLSYNLDLGFVNTDPEQRYSGAGPPTEQPGWLVTGAAPDCERWTNSVDVSIPGQQGHLGSFGAIAPGDVTGPVAARDGWLLELHPCWIPIRDGSL